MRYQPLLAVTVLAAAWLLYDPACAAVFPQDKGTWPKDWPKELEPLRESARTIGIGTGIQQNIYEIRFSDRETFERLWPVILKLKTPGAPLALYRTETPPPPDWGTFLSNAQPAVRIYAPSGGYSIAPELAGKIDPTQPFDGEQMVKEGKALLAGAPWPEKLYSPTGELPEWVQAKVVDGKFQWVPVRIDRERPSGFYNRARIELDLVVDGQVIDLNRIPLGDLPLRDYRFSDGNTDAPETK